MALKIVRERQVSLLDLRRDSKGVCAITADAADLTLYEPKQVVILVIWSGECGGRLGAGTIKDDLYILSTFHHLVSAHQCVYDPTELSGLSPEARITKAAFDIMIPFVSTVSPRTRSVDLAHQIDELPCARNIPSERRQLLQTTPRK